MHYSCQFNNEFAVRWLWSQGIKIDKVDQIGFTPLMFACQTGNVEIINLLIENGANSNRVFTNARSAQMYQNPTRTMLHFACESGNLDVIKLFGDINVNSLSWDGTPLNISAKKNSLEAVKYLLEKGAHPNIGSEFRDFPIINAAKSGNLEMIKLLVDAGADINITNAEKKTPLIFAVKGNYDDCIRYLLSKNASTKFMCEPLLLSCFINNKTEFALELIEICKDLIQQKDPEGNNIFHLLGYNEDIENMKKLPSPKEFDTGNNLGMTPLSLAALKNKEKSIHFFIENGCNPNLKDAKDFIIFFNEFFLMYFFMTALHLAIKGGNIDIVKFLIENEASLDIKDNLGVFLLFNFRLQSFRQL